MFSLSEPDAIGAFTEEARAAVYQAIALRRDVRHFRPDPVDDGALQRILEAAHQAPSVGFSQPWGFVIVRDVAQRERIRESFLRVRQAESARFPPERREAYLSYRLEGIVEAPLNLCVAVDLRPRDGHVLGTTAQPEAVRASACCAVQNLWLAARAEGLGMGWVSIVEPAVLRAELALPPGVEPIAYLCLGHPVAFRARPMLQELGWEKRRPVGEAIHPEGRWRREADPDPDLPTDPALPVASASAIPPLDESARAAAQIHQDQLTKPKGSLGRLEALATTYAAMRGRFPVAPPRARTLALFAADHGVVVEGVSAYGSQTTAAMVANVMAGGAAINALASPRGIRLVLVDAGVAGDLSAAPTDPLVPLVRGRIRAGTANLCREPAMSRSEAERALALGGRTAREAIDAGAELLGAGEIGIGNTTSAAALICALTGADPEEIVGPGTGLDPEARARKVDVVREALAVHRLDPADPVGVLAAVGGLELGALAGFYLEAARGRIPVVIDGFLGNAAALLARAIEPRVTDYLFAAHRSAEPGATRALAALGLEPLLDLGLRLGEGTGAALAMELIQAALDAQARMATFATAGIVGRSGGVDHG